MSRPRADTATWDTAALYQSSAGVSHIGGHGTDKLLGRVEFQSLANFNGCRGIPAGRSIRIYCPPPHRVALYTSYGSLWGVSTDTRLWTGPGGAQYSTERIALMHGTGRLAGHSLIGTTIGNWPPRAGQVQVVFRFRGTFR